LVVGCGGSGAKTIAYMLDQLAADLAQYGISEIPTGWQFVSVDVPPAAEAGPEGLPNVKERGYDYIGLAPLGASYRDVDFTDRTKAGRAGKLQLLGTWAPRKPEEVGTPISEGAGQFRAVGRMVTLNQLDALRDGLNKAWSKVNSDTAHSSMRQLSKLGGYDRNADPIVFVVSSMAGGAGASMALDVCRTLSAVINRPNLPTAVFMVGADVFQQGLDKADIKGVFANSLAMMGEIVACQVGSAGKADWELWDAMGSSAGDGAPFSRVFPIGARMGTDRALFGGTSATANTIYRGLARTLAALMTSPNALSDLISFDLTNATSVPIEDGLFGWSNSPEAISEMLSWGSIGYASVSMGRERYREYAAQRLARGAVDRLIHGHEQESSTASSEEQLHELVQSQWHSVCDRLGLWNGQGDFRRWMAEFAWSSADVNQIATGMMGTRAVFPDPGAAPDGSTWAQAVRHKLTDAASALERDANNASYSWAYAYDKGFQQRALDVVSNAIADFGLPYARAMVDKLAEHLRQIAGAARDAERTYSSVSLAQVDPDTDSALSALGRNVLHGGEQLLQKVTNGLSSRIRARLYGGGCGFVAQVWEGLAVSYLAPLSSELSNQLAELLAASRDVLRSAGLAQVVTHRYGDWPSEDEQHVDDRFMQAENEVLLTDASEYQSRFEQHVVGAIPDGLPYADSRRKILSQVIVGEWSVVTGDPAPGGLVTTTAAANLRVFTVEPGSNEPLVPQNAGFKVNVGTADVLGRARLFVGRADSSFDLFCRESLRDYLTANVPERVLQDRVKKICDSFEQALFRARPLSAPDAGLVQRLHQQQVRYLYKFSEIPFKGLAIESMLAQTLEQGNIASQAVLPRLQHSMSLSTSVRRIDIFGSYPKYAPICFSSVLEPALQDWSSRSPAGKLEYWMRRRTRPLPGALPCTDEERRAMVAGWWLGRVTGHLSVPGPSDFHYDFPAVRVMDPISGEWLDFRKDLLTDPQWLFEHPSDWLPAVLESMLLAVADAGKGHDLDSLRPYRVLRGLYDSAVRPSAPNSVSAIALLGDFLKGGVVAGGQSLVSVQVAATDPVDKQIEQRVEAVTSVLTKVGDQTKEMALPVSEPDKSKSLPLMTDMADDVTWAIGRIIELLPLAAKSATGTTVGGQGDQIW